MWQQNFKFQTFEKSQHFSHYLREKGSYKILKEISSYS